MKKIVCAILFLCIASPVFSMSYFSNDNIYHQENLYKTNNVFNDISSWLNLKYDISMTISNHLISHSFIVYGIDIKNTGLWVKNIDELIFLDLTIKWLSKYKTLCWVVNSNNYKNWIIDNINIVEQTPTPTPEPGTLILMAIGLFGIAGKLRFKYINV